MSVWPAKSLFNMAFLWIKFISICLIILFNSPVYAGRLHSEKYYQEEWCRQNQGVTEHVLDDKTRVDCLTCEYAVEVEFAEKWAESIGQALYYALKTGRQPGVVLIMEDTEKDAKYLVRLQLVAQQYNIKIWISARPAP